MALKAGRKGVNSKNVDQYGNLIGGGAAPYVLPTASPTTLGGVKPVSKTSGMTQNVGVDESGGLFTTPGSSYELPIATPTTLGGVQPVSKTSDMTQSVGVDGSGGLFTVPGSGGKFYYKEFTFNVSNDGILTCENVGVSGYVPISVSVVDVNSGYGGWASICMGYSGTNRYDIIGSRRGAGNTFKARVYYVASSMVEAMPT